MDVEIVKFTKDDKNSIEKIEYKSFESVDEANKFYKNWQCPEYGQNKYFICGKKWNTNMLKETIPNNYKYTYTYSVNLWNPLDNSDMEHSHNFEIYTQIIDETEWGRCDGCGRHELSCRCGGYSHAHGSFEGDDSWF